MHLFVHINNQMELPAMPGARVKKAFFLQGSAVAFQQNAGKILLSWPGALPDSNNTVIVLEMDKNTEQLPLLQHSTTR